MQQFQQAYLQNCAELSIEPQTSIINIIQERLKQDEGNKNTIVKKAFEILDLSGQSLTLKSCSALASALTDNNFFTKVVLADAFLGDDGIQS